MTTPQIFGLQVAINLIVYALVARWYIVPRLSAAPFGAALMALLFPHTLRTLGMVFLVPTVVDPNLPAAFASPAAYGDLLAALLALVAIVALRARFRLALALVWLFSIEGTLDLLNAIYQGLQHDLTRYQLGVAWYIPTFIVPALLVTHALIFVLLVTRTREYDTRRSGRLADQRA
jgi:hypothetical protein